MFTGELRKYQLPAFERMVDRRKVIVAYDMGTGKTPITIATVEELLEAGEVECGLVVTPSSLKYQWFNQLKRFSDNARVLVIDGDPSKRKAQYAKAHKYLYEYIIISYDTLVRDIEHVNKIPTDFMVLDEATAIKSFKAKRSKTIKQIRPKYRFALTGQPVENRPEELFSIMQWVDPKVLGNFVNFERTFIVRNKSTGQVLRYRNLKLLNKTLAGAMVRKKRTDPDVVEEMPLVTEETVSIPFDQIGDKLYGKIGKELLHLLYAMPKGSWNLFSHYGMGDDKESMQARGDIMARLTALRLLCDHPFLLHRSAEEYLATQADEKPKGSKYCAELSARGFLEGVKATPKLDETSQLVEELLDADPKNKVVVFSYYPAMLDMLASKVAVTNSVKLTGEMSAKARDVSIQQFTNDPNTRLFLSSDAGGYGVDLPSANYLINYDLPYSAGKLAQRNARIIRLSSEFESVTLINMVMRNTVEEHYYEMLVQKAAVASAWVDGKGLTGKQGTFELTLDSLTNFLESTL